MILVLGSPREPMVEDVYEELVRRGRRAHLVLPSDLPGTVRLSLRPGGAGFLRLADGTRLDSSAIRSVYQRIGFGDFEAFEDYSDEETRFVGAECLAALGAWLNHLDARVVNRPFASGTNASKPLQISLVEPLGFRIPETLVTNDPEAAREFYERLDGDVIYKSVSYVRSIVQVMLPEDLDRLDALALCPVQLQERIEGTDVRVHVVGNRLFPALIEAEKSDYRYDREARIVPWELPEEWAERCLALARSLDFTLAGIDLRVTPEDEVICFEVNPSPAFSWYEARTGQPIAAALCDVLEEA